MERNDYLKSICKGSAVRIFGVIFVLLLAVPWVCSATTSAEVVETIDPHGRINWSQWVIYVTEIAGPEWQTRQEPKEEDWDSATSPFSNLFSTIQRVRINSSTYLSEFIEEGSMVCNQLQGMTRKATVVKREYLTNGAVELTLAFDMTGGFAQLALPADIQPVPQIRTLEASGDEDRIKSSPSSAHDTTNGGGTYTGLLLDARGLSAKPCMSPKVMCESGDEVYGAAYVSREFAVQKGMVYYTQNLDTGKLNPRLGDTPLLVRALSVSGTHRCNFVISNADAAKIQGASRNLEFLKECKVAIVID